MSTAVEKVELKPILEEIASKDGGRLQPQSVVDAARKADHPLHDYFEWDNKKAGEAYRLDQARALIRSVKLTVQTETRTLTVPFYVRDPNAKTDEQGYRELKSIRSEEDAARATVVQEFGAAAAALRRARDIAEVLGMQDDVDQILDRVVQLRDSVVQ